MVSDIDEKGGQETAQAIKDGNGEAIFICADVSNAKDCQELVEATMENYGQLDIAFNNAGTGGEANPTADYSIENWQKVIGVNLSSVFYCMKYEIPAMLKAGGGAIVNMASMLEENTTVRDHLISLQPIGRLSEVEEVAELVVWLSSDKASFVTGAYYAIDGGYLAQ